MSFEQVPGDLSDNALKITFNVGENGWVGIAGLVEPGMLSNTSGIRLRYRGTGEPNTLELKLLYPPGAAGSPTFSVLWRGGTVTTNWRTLDIPYGDFECWTPDLCEGEVVDPDEVWHIDVAVSNKPGDTFGEGELIIDFIHAIPNTE